VCSWFAVLENDFFNQAMSRLRPAHSFFRSFTFKLYKETPSASLETKMARLPVNSLEKWVTQVKHSLEKIEGNENGKSKRIQMFKVQNGLSSFLQVRRPMSLAL
jgi:hypothetical protein